MTAPAVAPPSDVLAACGLDTLGSDPAPAKLDKALHRLAEWYADNLPGDTDRAVVRSRALQCLEDAGRTDAVWRLDVALGMATGASSEDASALHRPLSAILADPAALEAPTAVVPRLAWRGRVSLLAARERTGKSTTSGAAAAVVSYGGHWLGENTLAGPVLIVALEEHVGDVAGRLREWGADPDRVYLIDSLATATDPIDAIRRSAEAVRPVLLIVDTLAALVDHLSGRTRPDPGNATAWTPILARLTRIARDTDAALLLLHHARKSDGEYRDSTAIGAGVDAILTLSEDGQDADVRSIRVRARWHVGDYSIRLRPGEPPRYELYSGEMSLDARILAHVGAHPGCSMRQLRESVRGGNAAIDTAVRRLIERGAIEDRRDGSAGRQLHPAGAGHGARHGTRRTPVPPENGVGTPRARSDGTGVPESGNPIVAPGGTPPDDPDDNPPLPFPAAELVPLPDDVPDVEGVEL